MTYGHVIQIVDNKYLHMAWIPMYLNKQDEIDLVEFLNSESEIAFLVQDGVGKWKAIQRVTEIPTPRITLWHIDSGKLPLLTESNDDEWIERPMDGWKEKRQGRDSSNPYFGAGWPGVIHLNVRTDDSSKIGMSSFEWIGNHYSIIGISASEKTKKYWNRLRRQIKKRSVQIPRTDKAEMKPEIFAFSNAMKEIEEGKERSMNP